VTAGPPALPVVGRHACERCGVPTRRVRTPWGAEASVSDEITAAYDSRAGVERVVVVHAGGVSRMVRPVEGWVGQVVKGFELHRCGGGR
jgi:aspartate aminotransferase-like enzyme